jgi:hypothetical protein
MIQLIENRTTAHLAKSDILIARKMGKCIFVPVPKTLK